jgi:hypothetical protein
VLVEKVADDDDDVVENEEEEDDRLKVDEIEARRADFKNKEGRRKTGILWIMDE